MQRGLGKSCEAAGQGGVLLGENLGVTPQDAVAVHQGDFLAGDGIAIRERARGVVVGSCADYWSCGSRRAHHVISRRA